MAFSLSGLDHSLREMSDLQAHVLEGQRTQWLEADITSPIFASLHVAGAAEHHRALLERWRPRNIHL